MKTDHKKAHYVKYIALNLYSKITEEKSRVIQTQPHACILFTTETNIFQKSLNIRPPARQLLLCQSFLVFYKTNLISVKLQLNEKKTIRGKKNLQE